MVSKSERVVFAYHCILNQSSRARWQEGGASLLRRDGL